MRNNKPLLSIKTYPLCEGWMGLNGWSAMHGRSRLKKPEVQELRHGVSIDNRLVHSTQRDTVGRTNGGPTKEAERKTRRLKYQFAPGRGGTKELNGAYKLDLQQGTRR